MSFVSNNQAQTAIFIFPATSRIQTKVHTVICLNFGTLKIINFPFVPNGKLIILGVLTLVKHIRVLLSVAAHKLGIEFSG